METDLDNALQATENLNAYTPHDEPVARINAAYEYLRASVKTLIDATRRAREEALAVSNALDSARAELGAAAADLAKQEQ